MGRIDIQTRLAEFAYGRGRLDDLASKLSEYLPDGFAMKPVEQNDIACQYLYVVKEGTGLPVYRLTAEEVEYYQIVNEMPTLVRKVVDAVNKDA